MVCGDKKHVVVAHLRNKIVQPSRKLVKGFRITDGIVSVPVKHIEIDEIHEAQSVEISLPVFCGFIHSVIIIDGTHCIGRTPAAENVVNFTYGKHVFSRRFQNVEHSVFRGQKRKVVTAGSAGKITFIVDDKRSCDNPADGVFTRQNLPCDFAITVKFFDGNYAFVRGDLKHAVGGSIYYERAVAHTLFPVVFDDFRPRIRFIANRFSARQTFKFVDHVFRKTVRIGRKGRRRDNARDFPMSDSGIFARARFGKSYVRADRRRLFFTEVYAVDIEQP